MKSSLLLSAALVALLPTLPVATAHAQEKQVRTVDANRPNTRAAKRAAEAAGKGADPAALAPAYPNAARVSPEQKGSPKVAKEMAALFKLQESEGNADAIIAKADAILANPAANAFDKSSAAYLAGAAWQGKETDKYPNATRYYQLALENNGLHNNNHFRAMLQVAQMLAADGRNAEALQMVDRFLAETKSDDNNAYNVKAQILLDMDKPGEAATTMEKLLASKPGDKRLMLNLASVYLQSEQDAKAAAMFDKIRAAGLMTETKDYETAYHLLANIEGREKDALALIDEGLGKGLLKPNYDIYAFQGQVYYAQDKIPDAIAAWSKGAPLSPTGEMYLNVGKLQLGEEHWAEAKAAARSALDKGVKKSGDAWQVIGQAESESGNKAAAMAAYREAAKFPETKKWADASIRAAGGK